MNKRINFFTAVQNTDIPYEDFIIPYICSLLYHNHDSTTEILVSDSVYFLKENGDAVELLNSEFKNRFLIRNIPGYLDNLLPHSVRFLSVPVQKAEFTYIGDVDILILDGHIADWHHQRMNKTGLPYSNTLRKGQPMLTGLQCVHTEQYYALLDETYFRVFTESLKNKGIAYKHHDEKLLYTMVQHRIGRLPEDTYSVKTRPVHGIHMSQNREPLGQPGWEITPANAVAYLHFRETDIWQKLKPTFSEFYRNQLDKIDQVVEPVLEYALGAGKI